jgi:hypothetical protein
MVLVVHFFIELPRAQSLKCITFEELLHKVLELIEATAIYQVSQLCEYALPNTQKCNMYTLHICIFIYLQFS